jgi:serine/threonine-protein kinase
VLEGEIPAPSAVRAGVPAELDRICLLLLARDREARWGTAGEVVAALSRFAYSLEPPVTAGALAALVARTCPPVKRSERAISELEVEPTGVDVDRTRPMSARRPATVRTFAAQETFREVLSRATPLMPIAALAEPIATEPAKKPTEVRSSPPPRRRGALALAVIGLAAAGAAAIAFAARGTDQRAPVASDAAPRVAAAPHSDAAPPPPDAAPPRRPPDAGPKGRPTRPPPERGTGALRVGANPWADVLVDGKKVGEAPGTFPIAAGSHTVELRHRDRSRRFQVDIAPGDTRDLGLVDFTSE